ncbi:hypothetical protein KAI87_10950, partial [Myxococcota bacterium]|nr:hypothetical protein [Myxococcota bacterium]
TVQASYCGGDSSMCVPPPALAAGIRFGSVSNDPTDVEIANNIFIGGPSAQAISLYELGPAENPGSSAPVLAYNLLSSGLNTASYCAWAKSSGSSGYVAGDPCANTDAGLSLLLIGGQPVSDDDYDGNIISSEVGLCDFYHILDISPALGVASLEYPAPEHRDLDGDIRERDGGGTTDIGADHWTGEACVDIVQP